MGSKKGKEYWEEAVGKIPFPGAYGDLGKAAKNKTQNNIRGKKDGQKGEGRGSRETEPLKRKNDLLDHHERGGL